MDSTLRSKSCELLWRKEIYVSTWRDLGDASDSRFCSLGLRSGEIIFPRDWYGDAVGWSAEVNAFWCKRGCSLIVFRGHGAAPFCGPYPIWFHARWGHFWRHTDYVIRCGSLWRCYYIIEDLIYIVAQTTLSILLCVVHTISNYHTIWVIVLWWG